MRSAALALAFSLAACVASAAETTPVGLWRTFDDTDGLPAGLVRIDSNDGVLEAKVVKILPRPGIATDSVCEKCDGARKNQPVVGMTILWGLKRQGDEYAGGEILDPDNGNVYRCKLRLADDNQKLDVRGYLGISLFGRTQTWIRE